MTHANGLIGRRVHVDVMNNHVWSRRVLLTESVEGVVVDSGFDAEGAYRCLVLLDDGTIANAPACAITVQGWRGDAFR